MAEQLIWIISLVIYLAAGPPPEKHEINGFAQGTSYQITYYAERELVGKKQTDSILDRIDSSLSIYKPYSLISRFNGAESELATDEYLETVVRKSLEITANTGGAFDITVKPLVQAWGFGTKAADSEPDPAKIKALLTCVGSDKLLLKKGVLTKKAPCVEIDVNGIAQGYSVDLLAEFLDRRGISNYLVEIGGEIRVRGKKPSGEPFRIGIEGPPAEGSSDYPVQRAMKVISGAVTTSGNYRKYHLSGKKKVSHLMDPHTGYPLSNELISVTVWAKDGITADGYDNALMGMGLQKALLFLKKHKGLEAYFVYHRANGVVADTATEGFLRMLHQGKGR